MFKIYFFGITDFNANCEFYILVTLASSVNRGLFALWTNEKHVLLLKKSFRSHDPAEA